MISTLALLVSLSGVIDDPTPAAPSAQEQAASNARVAWYTDWDQALAEAKRTGRPILLQSAAPRCHNVPGRW